MRPLLLGESKSSHSLILHLGLKYPSIELHYQPLKIALWGPPLAATFVQYPLKLTSIFASGILSTGISNPKFHPYPPQHSHTSWKYIKTWEFLPISPRSLNHQKIKEAVVLIHPVVFIHYILLSYNPHYSILCCFRSQNYPLYHSPQPWFPNPFHLDLKRPCITIQPSTHTALFIKDFRIATTFFCQALWKAWDSSTLSLASSFNMSMARFSAPQKCL